MVVPMDMTVSATVVITVCTTLHVTNRLDIVTRDVTRDILTMIAPKANIHMGALNITLELFS